MSYFEKTYIGKWQLKPDTNDATRMRLKWKKPSYDPKLWSVYNRVVQGEPRTTGNLEAWHRRFGTLVNKSHPSIWQLLKDLQLEQIHTEGLISKLVAGHTLNKSRKDQVAKDTRIANIVASYPEMKKNAIDYSKGCTHNFDY